MDILKQTATTLGREIESGKLDPVDLCEAHIEAIEAHPNTPQIFTEVTKARARSEALAAQKRAKTGSRKGDLDGVSVSWKDLFDSAGVRTEAGSDLLKDRVPDCDADVLSTASLGGSVCIGKTHMSELAFSGLGYNPVKQTPPCVNDAEAVPGGSSSGAAASVAFGLAPLAIGSDTGGSVRIPSAWNDLVGLKTTPGRVSLKGVVPLCAKFDTVGPLCRSVEDAAHALALLEGGKAADLSEASLKGARIGVLRTVAFDMIEDEPQNGFEQSLSRLKAAGAEVSDVEFKPLVELLTYSPILFASEAYGTWKSVIEKAPEKMFPEILERFRGGADFTAADYVAAWLDVDRIRAEWCAIVAGYDAIILPTAPILPPNLKRLKTDHSYYVKMNLLALRNTRIGNLLGLCALTLPTGVPSTGISLMGQPMQEERLLRIGRAAEIAIQG
ncbi:MULTISPECIES: amidase [Halocynthiibacter]|uniref:Amidase family protein n=1 Tax=Halocynthiibacter halioticoli TaxID=2986804 RepID=A0AAE3J0G8_9RHOB|nr:MULTISPECIES: amidase family protein [Halocynthiibacter]MCV6825712.1 amidase family protein [Halocynthiibacter halioticoli]MCW4058713.1 amidase family protein [Halocynthiibacter sp. SDUM655004]